MEREVDQINVIPLVDIMLVLLVIVLTTATFITTGQIPVNLSKASTSGDRQDRPIVVTVTAERTVSLNDRGIEEEQLDIALAPYPRPSLVLVRADKVTRLERFVSIVDRIRSMGFQQVSLEVIRT